MTWWRAPERVLTLVNIFGVLVLMQGIGIGTLIYRDITRVEVSPHKESNSGNLKRAKPNSEPSQPLDRQSGNPILNIESSDQTFHLQMIQGDALHDSLVV